MARIFAYIAHKGGVADDTAAELLAAAKMIDPAASPTAIVTGSGAELDAVCKTLQDSYGEIWKVSNDALAYPNAELVRKALVAILPPGSIVLLPHSHFGVDLGAGSLGQVELGILSPTSWPSKAWTETFLKVVRQEFGGQMSAHVRCDISTGAVINLRPGAFKPVEGRSRSRSCRRQVIGWWVRCLPDAVILETVIAEVGDVDISKEAVLVSIGRGIQEQDNVAIAQELADALGASGELLAACG